MNTEINIKIQMETKKTLSDESIDKKVIDAVMHVLEQTTIGFTEPDVKENSYLRDDLGFDSLDVVELEVELERRLPVSLPVDTINGGMTVADVKQAVRKYLK